MEALGVASSIAGLVSLADVIAFKVSRFYTLAKGAHSDIKALLVEIQSLYGVLNSLKLLASCLEAEQPPPYANTKAPEMDHFHTCRANLDELKRALGKFDLDSMKPLTRVRTKLMWPMKSTETKELVEKIARNKRDLADALTADGLTTLVKALSSQNQLTETMEDVQMQLQQMAEEKAENEQDERKRKVFDWCSKVDPYEKHKNAKSLRHPNTVLWFFDCPEYQKWMEESNSSIWLFGIPGAGKTILTSAVIENAKKLAETKPRCALAYYYCEYRLPETQILSNILGSLIKQICASSAEAFEELDLFYSERNEKAKHPALPTGEELDKFLRRLSTSFDSVMVIVDGLDEISDPEEQSKVLKVLSTLNTPTDGSIKVIYTSRDEIDIKQYFSESKGISIAARGNDLELFVAAVIEDRIKNRSLRLRDPALKGIIINGIVSKANGMFQWAKCQLDYLCLLSTDKERRNALDTLPKDLFETYRRILDRVNNSTPGNRSLVQRTLRWMLFSEEPMDAETVATAIAIEIDSDYMDGDDIPDVDSILKWCSSLVRRDESSGTLSFSHFTVEEFLEDDQLLETPELRYFHMSRNPSELILAKVCLTYLNFEQFSDLAPEDIKEKADDLPFLKYAAKHWFAHAFTEREVRDTDEILFDLICRLFNPIKSPNFMLWLQIYWRDQDGKIPKAAPTLHIAAGLGLVRVCKWLLEKKTDINFIDATLGSPLICAIKSIRWHNPNRPEVVRLLLEHGARADVQFLDTRRAFVIHGKQPSEAKVTVTPMSLALDLAARDTALCGEIVRALLKVNELSSFEHSTFWGLSFRTPFWSGQFRPKLAGRSSRSTSPSSILSGSSVPVISSRSASPSSNDGLIQPPINTPLNCRRYFMIQLFRDILNHKSASSLDTETKSKVLSFLNRYGTSDADKELVSEIATKENLALSTFATAEFAKSAAENGQTHLIRALIAKNADPRIMSECLAISVRAGITEMLDLLLDYCPKETPTIQLNIQKSWIAAVNGGNVENLKIFIKHGIDVNMVIKQSEKSTVVPRSGPAIAHAVLNGVLESVEFLTLLPEIDLTIKVDGRNLLQLAARSHQKRGELIDILLDKGVDPLEVDDRGGTVLHYLLSNPQGLDNKDVDIIRRLIARGCDIEAIDDEGNSLMHVLFEWRSHQLPCFEELVALIFVSKMVSIPTKGGTLILLLAIRARQPAHIIRKLIPDDLSLWNAKEGRKFTPLHEVVVPRIFPRAGPGPSPQALEADEIYMMQTLEILLEVKGVDINVKNQQGNTPLLTAASNCTEQMSDSRAQIFKKFLDSGADVNARNDNGWTVLHFLTMRGFNAGLFEVLKFKPEINSANAAGNTPLHTALAANFDQSIAVRLLLEHDSKNCKGSGEGKVNAQIKNKENVLAIHIGAQNGQAEAIHIMYENSHVPDVDVRTPKKETPLHLATSWNRPITARLLVDLGADLNAADVNKQTPLHWAADVGNEQLVAFLVERGASSIAENNSGFQPWACAAIKGHQDLMNILKDYADVELVEKYEEGNSKTENTTDGLDKSKELDEIQQSAEEESRVTKSEEAPPGAPAPSKTPPLRDTAMIKALETGNLSFVQALLTMGVDPNEPINEDKRTALAIACAYKFNDIVKLLLSHGASINSRDKFGNLPLHIAAFSGHPHVVKTLYEAGARLDARNFYMKTALHSAAIEGELESAKMLTGLCSLAEKGAKVPLRAIGHPISGAGSEDVIIDIDKKITKSAFIEMRNGDRETALLSALDCDSLDVAKFLVKEGANVFVRDRVGCNALWHACRFADKELVETFLSKGLDINAASYAGFGCLHSVIDREFDKQEDITEIALLLIKAGADLSSKNPARIAPLHCACSTGNVVIIKELLSRMPKGELDVESGIHGTPIYAASFRGHLEVVKILLEKEVDVNLGMRGESPLEAATVEGHREVVELLEKHGAVRTREVAWSLTFRGRLAVKNSDVDAKTIARVNTLKEEKYEEPDTDKGFATAGERSLLDPEPYGALSLDEKAGS